MSWLARLASALVAALTTGCAATFPEDSSRIITFADTVSDFDVVPPGWITPDGNAGGTYTFGSDSKALAFIFPSMPLGEEARGSLHVSIPDFLGQNGWFRGGVFAFATAPAAQPTIEISTARSDSAIVIDIDASSMSQILRLDLDRFRKLQAAYVGWLLGQSGCLTDCFSPAAAEALRAFWKNHVLRDASFRQFAARYLNPPAPETLTARDTTMFATRISPRQQLSVTWGNQNFYPDTSDTGGEAALRTSYSRTTSGGNTRLQILVVAGRTRLYPARSCASVDIKRERPNPTPHATLPYPPEFRKLFPKWFMPIYNLFDLHNPYLLTAPERTNDDPTTCGDRARRAPRHLFLLTPAYYVKPDNWKGTGQFETEGSIGRGDDVAEQFLLLTRQFVILACDRADPSAVADEWHRMLDAAAGNDRGHGACGRYLHGVFSAKTFVELKNHFSLDGRAVEDGVVHFTGLGQAVGPSLASRLNVEAVPGSKPLLHLLRAVPAESPNPRRVLLRFYTTISDVLDEAAVLEGDDIHAISVPEILR
jgi:hypothetical protein